MDQPAPQAIPPAPKLTKVPVILSVLLCISLAIIGLLLYQNIQLKKQLASLKTASPWQPAFISPEPVAQADDSTAGWKTYTDPNYKFSINIPSDWKIQRKGDYSQGEYYAKIYPDYKTEEGYDDTALYIGSPFVFSTSGAICANASCKQHDLFQVTIAGNMYSSPIMGEYMNGTNRIIRSRFQFEIDSNMTNKPTVTANFHTIEDKDTFDQILSTFKFIDGEQNTENLCQGVGGRWNTEYNECESETSSALTEKWCRDNGGNFSNASPCRHDPEFLEGKTACINVVMKVCKF